ncbi:MAG: sialidase family protein [Actinomycetota bacterium]
MRRVLVIPFLVVLVLAMGAPGRAATNTSFPKRAPDPVRGVGGGEALYRNPPSPICTTAPSLAANVNTDCEPGVGIHNETAIAVNPTNPLNMIGSANDYQLKVSAGGQVHETVFSRAHVTFDGGETWTTYPVRFNGYKFTGDPSVAFDGDGVAYLATLAGGGDNTPDVVVSRSPDGGRHWSTPVLVAAGKGSFSGRSVFPDHPILAAWGHGNVIVTWIQYIIGHRAASLVTVPIVDAVSHDHGATFSGINDISGSAPFCIGLAAAHSCDQTWGNAPAVSPTGDIVVSFYDTSEYAPDGSTNLARNTHMAVRVDPATGALAEGPFLIGLAYDGINEGDFPVSVDGRQTLHDSEFRLLMQGNIAADPTDATGRHFAVVWFDDRNAPLPVDPDPYKAVTNSDVIVSQSFDGGRTWSAPAAIAQPGDQFMPWAAYDSSGRLRVGYFDRSYDPANHEYGYTLATETAPGSLTFSTQQVTTELSNPTTGDRFFAVNVDPGFPFATRFVGDYSGIATTPGHVVAYWTDMRETVCVGGRCGAGENTYFANVP